MNQENTVAEIKKALDELGIKYNPKATKDELLSLFPKETDNEGNDDEGNDYENDEFKDYVIINNSVHLRDENERSIGVVRKGDVFNGILVDDKIVNKDGNTVVAKFMKEVK